MSLCTQKYCVILSYLYIKGIYFYMQIPNLYVCIFLGSINDCVFPIVQSISNYWNARETLFSFVLHFYPVLYLTVFENASRENNCSCIKGISHSPAPILSLCWISTTCLYSFHQTSQSEMQHQQSAHGPSEKSIQLITRVCLKEIKKPRFSSRYTKALTVPSFIRIKGSIAVTPESLSVKGIKPVQVTNIQEYHKKRRRKNRRTWVFTS